MKINKSFTRLDYLGLPVKTAYFNADPDWFKTKKQPWNVSGNVLAKCFSLWYVSFENIIGCVLGDSKCSSPIIKKCICVCVFKRR